MLNATLPRALAVTLTVVLAFSLFFVSDNTCTSAGEKSKLTISEIMKRAMASGLCKKCTNGKASEPEKQKLVELFTMLASNSPPKGDSTSWKTKTQALLLAAKSVAKGEMGAERKLDAAVDCRACHTEHKK